jgi:hypothetical protein
MPMVMYAGGTDGARRTKKPGRISLDAAVPTVNSSLLMIPPRAPLSVELVVHNLRSFTGKPALFS